MAYHPIITKLNSFKTLFIFSNIKHLYTDDEQIKANYNKNYSRQNRYKLFSRDV